MYPDGTMETITGSTSQVSILSSSLGCDSTVTTNIAIAPGPQTTVNDTICAGTNYTFPDGSNSVLNQSTQQSFVFSMAGSCDSTVVADVTVLAPESSIFDTVCPNTYYTYGDGTTELISNASAYSYIMPSSSGCDSSIHVYLEIFSVASPFVTQQSDSLFGNPSNQATYQWLDCNNGMQSIVGETDYIFQPSSDGDYAVIISDGNCSDTSTCFTFDTSSLPFESETGILLYPNPAESFIALKGLNGQALSVSIQDVSGKTISTHKVHGDKSEINIENLSPGCYFVCFSDFTFNPLAFIKE